MILFAAAPWLIVHRTRADSYARKNWVYHVTNSLPTQAVMINLRDFIHEEHSLTHGSEKLMLVICWLKVHFMYRLSVETGHSNVLPCRLFLIHR